MDLLIKNMELLNHGINVNAFKNTLLNIFER